MTSSLPRVNLNEPKFNQNTFGGRAKHFFLLTNPLNIFVTNKTLEKARRIVTDYKAGKDVPDVKSLDELWYYKYLYDSAFHPETGEKNIIIGRMSSQMPMNCFITGAMLTFYKTTPAVMFWQWFNQTYNAIVNYSNRSGSSPISNAQLVTSYCLATGGAMATALSLNKVATKFPPIFARWVPFVAVAAANCVNIPMMRLQELQNGIKLVDEQNNEMGFSKKAAFIGISSVIASRIFMAIPGMTMVPVLTEHLDQKGFFKKYPNANCPLQIFLCGFFLIFTTPLGCAFFKQQKSINVDSLEKDVRDNIKKKNANLTTVYYNKGL